jgi:hypothetical protein
MTQSFTTARHWQQSYDARVPADINPDTWPSVVAMAEDAMQRHASHTAFHCFDHSLSMRMSTRSQVRLPPTCSTLACNAGIELR